MKKSPLFSRRPLVFVPLAPRLEEPGTGYGPHKYFISGLSFGNYQFPNGHLECSPFWSVLCGLSFGSFSGLLRMCNWESKGSRC